MILGGRALAGLFAVLAASSGAASASSSLDCMSQSYDAEQLAKIEKDSAGFSIDPSSDDKTAGFGETAITAADVCADKSGWTEDQIYYAMLYEIGRLGEAAFRRSGGLTAEQISKLDMALAKQDRTELWAMLEKTVVAGLTDQKADLTSQEEVKLGIFVIAAGLGTEQKIGENVGVLLGMMAIQRYSRREFEALEKKE